MAFFPDRAKQALKFDELNGQFDPWLVAISIALACIGIVMVASKATLGEAPSRMAMSAVMPPGATDPSIMVGRVAATRS